jgi:hypothetical protein
VDAQRLVAAFAQRSDLVRAVAEDEDVLEASVPAVEICSDRSAPGMMTSATDTP